MKETIKKNRKIILISIIIMILLFVGIAFAYLVTTLYGEKEYIVRVGTLGLKLEEVNELTLEKVIPIEDSEGLNLEGFNFSLINEGSINTDFTIYLDDIELAEGEERMPNSALRYSLTIDDKTKEPDYLENMGTSPNRIVDSGTIGIGESINYTIKLWIDYDTTTEEASGKVFKAKLRVVSSQEKGENVSDVVLANVGDNGSTYDDGEDTFITGEDPNNYIWYSGKLWRAVSVNNEEKTTKLVTQWNISAIPYSSGSTSFEGSFMEDWLNDTSVDGFLGNLREPEKFIVMDAKWNATEDATNLGSITRPNNETGTIVTDAVGLLNMYEYQTSYKGTISINGYLNNGHYWWSLTPYSSLEVRSVYINGNEYHFSPSNACGARPSINLKSDIKIVSGNGTIDNPYRLNGDNDTNLTGVLLSSRYSGEYIRFGNEENNLYRIVSHETFRLTKITSAEPLKDSGTFKTSAFGSNTTFSSTNTIGTFLNGDYLTNYVNSRYSSMIEEDTTWYLGTVAFGTSYKLAKYTDVNATTLTSSITTAKVGLLRLGELNSGQFERYAVKGGSSSTGLTTYYWTLTPYSTSYVRSMSDNGSASDNSPSDAYGIRPSLNLKSNVVITGGDGTKENPFTLSVQ